MLTVGALLGSRVRKSHNNSGRVGGMFEKCQEKTFPAARTARQNGDADAEAQLNKTVRLDAVNQEDCDTVFYAGGHGPMWDLADDKNSIKLIVGGRRQARCVGLPRSRRPSTRQDLRRQAARRGART